MREMTIEQLKTCQLEIMSEIHNFCDKNGLKYSLWGGSLIGAARHNGYIPWDDDMDICMLRKDYEFFINNFNSDKFGVANCDDNALYHPVPREKQASRIFRHSFHAHGKTAGTAATKIMR